MAHPIHRPALALLAFAAGAAAVLVSGCARQPEAPLVAWGRAPDEVRAVLWPEPRTLPDFVLMTQHGQRFGPAELRGQWSFLFFGYLNCPDVCPVTLHALRAFRRLLQEQDSEAAGYRIVFVSVDPERDTAARIGPYLAHFDVDFIGLSGAPEELRRFAEALAVRYEAVTDVDGLIAIDHTSSVMIVDPAGQVVGALPPPHQPERMVASFRGLRDYLGR